MKALTCPPALAKQIEQALGDSAVRLDYTSWAIPGELWVTLCVRDELPYLLVRTTRWERRIPIDDMWRLHELRVRRAGISNQNLIL